MFMREAARGLSPGGPRAGVHMLRADECCGLGGHTSRPRSARGFGILYGNHYYSHVVYILYESDRAEKRLAQNPCVLLPHLQSITPALHLL